jgi:hypothetical protein
VGPVTKVTGRQGTGGVTVTICDRMGPGDAARGAGTSARRVGGHLWVLTKEGGRCAEEVGVEVGKRAVGELRQQEERHVAHG